MRKVLALTESAESRYADISFQGSKWMGRHKSTGATETLPVNAFELVPLQGLLPDLDKTVHEIVGQMRVELSKDIADLILAELEKVETVDPDRKFDTAEIDGAQ